MTTTTLSRASIRFSAAACRSSSARASISSSAIRPAAAQKRPCHAILVEPARDQVDEDDRPALNKLRTALDAGNLGAEGFNTALRLGPGSVGDVKRIVFRPPPKDD